MSEDNINLANLLPTDLSTEVAADDVTSLVKSGDWLPRIVICGSTTTLVQEQKIGVGVFACQWSDTNFRDLGKQIDFLSLTFRPKAMRLKTPDGRPVSFFDRKSDEFRKVAAESEIKNSGCVWGPEFLIWLPVANTFALYFCNNPTMRRAAPDLFTIMRREGTEHTYDPKPASSVMEFIKKPTNQWWGARFEPHTTPLPQPEMDDFAEVAREQIQKFRNPPKSQVEVETAAATNAAGGRVR